MRGGWGWQSGKGASWCGARRRSGVEATQPTRASPAACCNWPQGKRGLPAAREEQQGHLSALAEAGAAGSESTGGSEAAGAGGGDSGGVGELGNGGKSVSGHQQEQQQQQGSEAGGGSMGAEGQEDKGEAGPGAGSQPSNQQEAERRREERRQAIEEAAGSEQQQQQQLVQGKGDDKQEGQGGGTSSSSSGAAGGSSESGSSSSSSERCPPLSKKLLEGLARNGTIMYSLLNRRVLVSVVVWLAFMAGELLCTALRCPDLLQLIPLLAPVPAPRPTLSPPPLSLGAAPSTTSSATGCTIYGGWGSLTLWLGPWTPTHPRCWRGRR